MWKNKSFNLFMKKYLLFLLIPFVASSEDWATRSIHLKQAQALMHNTCSESPILVGIIDTGIDVHHKDLQDSIWKNPSPKKMNFFGDFDFNGWNFVNNNNTLSDYIGHGTHIAGIISGKKNGMCPGIKVIAAKYYDPEDRNNENVRNTVDSIKYLIEKGVKIINYSTNPSYAFMLNEYNALDEARKNGILFITSAGNQGLNLDDAHSYPISYQLDNIISVANINELGKLQKLSNYGSKTIDIAAPGNNIVSTIPYNDYGMMTGTSQSTAFVSGLAALLLTENPNLKYNEVKNIILNHGIKTNNLIGKLRSNSKIDALEAMKAIQ